VTAGAVVLCAHKSIGNLVENKKSDDFSHGKMSDIEKTIVVAARYNCRKLLVTNDVEKKEEKGEKS
jgi:hypothetical protein